MVNSISKINGWRLGAVAISCIACCCMWTKDALAQRPYQNENYRIYSNQPAPFPRTARATNPATTAVPITPFRVDVVDPPAPTGASMPTELPVTSSRLNRAFKVGAPRTVAPKRGLADLFNDTPQEDETFGKQGVDSPATDSGIPGSQQQPTISPFKKLDPEVSSPQPANPQKSPTTLFQDTLSNQNSTQQETPPTNPFKQLPFDPNPITPPMDTSPIEPRLPDGSEFTPDPNSIDRNPPIPGEPTTPDQSDPGAISPREPTLADPKQEDPGLIQPPGDDQSSVKSGQEENPNGIEDLAPVPRPDNAQRYLPAKDPSYYAVPPKRMLSPAAGMVQANPYGNLPGPYGYDTNRAMPYPQQPVYPPAYGQYGQPPASYPGYPAPSPYAMPYGQCGPGCTPTHLCGSCSMAAMQAPCCSAPCGGCNQGTGCNDANRPVLPGTDIGDRVVETGVASATETDTYVDVVGDCDEFCSNYTNCYIGLFGGWSDLSDFVTTSDQGTGVYFEDAGYLFGATIGQIQGRNLRTELELSYRNIDINGLRLDGSVPSQGLGVNGDFGTLAGMLNGYWEFVDFRMEKIKPYIGGGIGFALARPNLLQVDGLEAVVDHDQSSFAWQWMAGLNYKASPTLDAFVEYRYFAADSFRLDTQLPEVTGLGNGTGPFDYRSGSVLFGLRARF